MDAKQQKRKKRLILRKTVAGSLDVLRIAALIILISVLLFVLFDLIKWVIGDINIIFADLGTSIMDAILIHNPIPK